MQPATEEKKKVNLRDVLPEKAMNAIFAVLDKPDITIAALHAELVAALEPYKDKLEDNGMELEYMASAIEVAVLRASKPPGPAPGARVKVHDGTGENYLGEGTYEGEVEVYVIRMPDGSIRSAENAEEPPPPGDVPPGCSVQKIPGNPKIRLDSGRVVYGAQVWWDEI